MKCENCGNNLQIEDKVCPFCGKPNPFAKQHQKEMAKFSRKFEKTRTEVLEESARFNKKTVRITILAVLVALCAVLAFLCTRADDIRWDRRDRAIERNAAEYSVIIDGMMEARDYSGLYRYMSVNHLNYADAMQDYDAVASASMYYARFYESLMTLNAKAKDPDKYKYSTEEELFETLTGAIRGIRDSMEENKYHPERHSAEKMAYMADMCETVRTMLTGYLDLTEDEAAQIFELSAARLTVMLEEAYGR